MTLDYVACTFEVQPLQPASDLLMAELGNLGFESFEETPTGIVAYINKNFWAPSLLDSLEVYQYEGFTFSHTIAEIPQQNWNESWEQNFSPIQVGNSCVVRAPFHEKPSVDYDIVIEPKMSFGTGHHETTHMMLAAILELDCKGKFLLDMGSGTGVLAILAAMRGATAVDAIDIDHWCYENAMENVQRNHTPEVAVYEGTAALLNRSDFVQKSYDIILANINRNILLEDMPIYVSRLKSGGYLLMSGFYFQDLGRIKETATTIGLQYVSHQETNDWVAAIFKFE